MTCYAGQEAVTSPLHELLHPPELEVDSENLIRFSASIRSKRSKATPLGVHSIYLIPRQERKTLFKIVRICPDFSVTASSPLKEKEFLNLRPVLLPPRLGRVL